MRLLTTGPCATTILVLLLVTPATGSSRRIQASTVAIQPTESTTDLLLLSRPGWARIESRDGSRTLSFPEDQSLTAVAELADGWVAAGVRSESEGSSVFFVADGSGLPDRLPPVPQREAIQLRPVLMVLDGDLKAAAWLEGEGHRSLAVRSADWTGVGWGPAVTVSAPGPGSQTGLSGVALRRGELLLAWSRFDGTDDEVYWSSNEASNWTRPHRVSANNRVPDVSPVLARSGRGATLVWAQMKDGEYRLQARRFDSEDWGAEHLVDGAGSIFPTLVRRDDRLFVLYRKAAPRGWGLAEFDDEGSRVRRSAITLTADPLRPTLGPKRPAGRAFDWPQSARSAKLHWRAVH